MRLRISNGRIFDPASKLDVIGDVCIADGRILSLGKSNSDFSADIEIDATEKLVCPGLVDLSARLREPGHEHKATIASESAAATASGITSICCPPDTLPVVDTPAVAELIQQHAGAVDTLQVYPLAAMTVGLRGERLSEMTALRRAGCVGVSNAGAPVSSTEILGNAMEYAHSCNMTVFIEPEDYYLGNSGVVHDGAVSTRLGLAPIPVTAETVAIGTVLLLAEQIGGRVHIGRISAARSIQMIANARKEGLSVSCDTAICNLHLTDMDVAGYRAECHLRPPLRDEADRAALCRGIEDGSIDAICSNHQPHDDDAKAAPFAETEAGASTIEHLLSLSLELVKRGEFSLEQAVLGLTSAPARILGIEAGTLSEGGPADLALVDLEASHNVDRAGLLSAGKNTPFHGWELRGGVSHTICRGQIVYQKPEQPR